MRLVSQKFIAISFAAAITAATPAVVLAQAAPANQAAETEEEAEADEDANRRVCRSYRSTGSRYPRRVCHTQAEWARMDADMRDLADDMRREGASVAGGSDDHVGPAASPN